MIDIAYLLQELSDEVEDKFGDFDSDNDFNDENIDYDNLNKYTIMLSNNTLDNADLKSRLARFGINNPITNTTRNVLLKKLLKLEMDSQNKCNNQSDKLDCKQCKPMLNKYTIMSSSNTLDDADLKSRLARFGINNPITNTTRNVLLKKLLKLEMDSQNKCNNQSDTFSSECELMDTSTNDLNEYEIRDGISKYGLKPVPLTDSTRPVISSIIRKKNKHS
ncbi:uncharacterized protein LOC112596772 [Melanaphis sacchari]|uniref:uncharacterized protein LOC112596772 n=1 Tax=Melanaphis sacchari TaxID=742174 RepID=UPI000DC14429|nr:uncharacterized protein LOC112596772 [Melanaphis sacchari]